MDKTAMAVRGYDEIIWVSICSDVFLRVGREGKEDWLTCWPGVGDVVMRPAGCPRFGSMIVSFGEEGRGRLAGRGSGNLNSMTDGVCGQDDTMG